MLAFDATYLTSTLTQMQLNNVRGMVGGIWSPDQPSNAFLPLDDELDFNKVVKAASVLEMLVWDPTMKKKIPLPICEVPLQHNFSGTGASHRGNWYMAGLVGSVMAKSNNLIKGVVFDSHGTHGYIRKLLHGQVEGLEMEDVRNLPWFGKLEYTPLPECCLPRLPIAIAKHEGETVLGIPGCCSSAMGWHWDGMQEVRNN